MKNPDLPTSFLWIVISILFLTVSVSSSDPCPPASKLYPCWCVDFPLTGRTTISIGSPETTSSYYETSTAVQTVTATGTSTAVQTVSATGTSTAVQTVSATEQTVSTTEEPARRRRHLRAKRQVNPFLAMASYYTVVTCNGTNDIHGLEQAIGEGLKRRWIDKLIASNIWTAGEDTLVRLPNGWLKNTRLKELVIENTLLAPDFLHSGSPLDGQNQSMIWLTVNNCSLGGQLSYSDVGTVNTFGLSKLHRLEGIDFSRNNLESIRDMAFRYPPMNLTTIDLSYNNIKVLQNRCFQYIPKLESMDLSHNYLETIQRNVFASPATHLYHINLSWNRFSSLPSDFFTKMPALKIVNMSNNYLYSLPSTVWAAPWSQLNVIILTGNFIPCDCSLMWLLPVLSNSTTNGTSTAAPQQARNQTIHGYCSLYRRDSYPQHYALTNLTRSSLKC